MPLTPWHQIPLQNYRNWHRNGGPTFFGVFCLSLKRHAAVAALVITVLVWVHFTSNSKTPLATGLICGGMWLGMVVNDVANILALIRFWPILDQTIDWQRVDAFLDQSHSAETH